MLTSYFGDSVIAPVLKEKIATGFRMRYGCLRRGKQGRQPAPMHCYDVGAGFCFEIKACQSMACAALKASLMSKTTSSGEAQASENVPNSVAKLLKHEAERDKLIAAVKVDFCNAFLGAAKIFDLVPWGDRKDLFEGDQMKNALLNFGFSLKAAEASESKGKGRRTGGAEKVSACSPEQERAILDLLHPKVSLKTVLTKDIADKVKLSAQSIAGKLNWLKQQGKIDFKPVGKAGKGWFKS